MPTGIRSSARHFRHVRLFRVIVQHVDVVTRPLHVLTTVNFRHVRLFRVIVQHVDVVTRPLHVLTTVNAL